MNHYDYRPVLLRAAGLIEHDRYYTRAELETLLGLTSRLISRAVVLGQLKARKRECRGRPIEVLGVHLLRWLVSRTRDRGTGDRAA